MTGGGTDQGEYIWYFSFGANMDKHTLTNRRGVVPKESRACKVPGYGIVFDLPGIMYVEPAFASISPLESDDGRGVVHGVAHLIKRDDYEVKIRGTEGGNGHEGHGYASIDVMCEDYNGQTFTAKALSTYENRSRKGHLPSLRYLQILRRGAREHKLDEQWIQYLDSLQHYEHSLLTRVAAAFVILLCMVLVMPFFIVNILSVRFLNMKTTPRILVEYMTFVMGAVWLIHDHLFHPVFGSGRCNTGREKKSD